MSTRPAPVEDAEEEFVFHELQHPLSAYTFPTETPRIHKVRFDDTFIHVDLVDGRSLSVPLSWIPTLHSADPAELEKYKFNRGRTGIIWDPDTCSINDEFFIRDYLGPCPKVETKDKKMSTDT